MCKCLVASSGIASLVALSVLAMPASAQVTTFELTGTIDIVSDPLDRFDSSVGIGTPFTATLTFNAAAPDTQSHASYGQYYSEGAPYGTTISVGNYSFAGTSLSASASNNVVTGNSPNEDLYQTGTGNVTGSHGVNPVSLTTLFRQDAGTAISSDAQVIDPANLLNFTFRSIYINGPYTIPVPGGYSSEYLVRGNIKSISVSGGDRVPEPGTLALLALGALPVLVLRRRK